MSCTSTTLGSQVHTVRLIRRQMTVIATTLCHDAFSNQSDVLVGTFHGPSGHNGWENTSTEAEEHSDSD